MTGDDLWRRALADEPPMELNLAAIEATGRRRVRRRQSLTAGGMALAVVVLVAGAMAVVPRLNSGQVRPAGPVQSSGPVESPGPAEITASAEIWTTVSPSLSVEGQHDVPLQSVEATPPFSLGSVCGLTSAADMSAGVSRSTMSVSGSTNGISGFDAVEIGFQELLPTGWTVTSSLAMAQDQAEITVHTEVLVQADRAELLLIAGEGACYHAAVVPGAVTAELAVPGMAATTATAVLTPVSDPWATESEVNQIRGRLTEGIAVEGVPAALSSALAVVLAG